MHPQIDEELFNRLAQPLIHFIKEFGHPHMSISITSRGAEVVETLLGVPAEKTQKEFIYENGKGELQEKQENFGFFLNKKKETLADTSILFCIEN
jgi:hypothetical protein